MKTKRESIYYFSKLNLDKTPESSEEFSTIEYSRFKHGDEAIAKKYGFLLAKKYIEINYAELIDKGMEDTWLTSTAYNYIPHASMYLTKYFRDYLNQFLLEHNQKSINEFKFQRMTQFTGDYTNASVSQRRNIVSNSHLAIDSSLLKDKRVIAIDDVRLTGAHENRVYEILMNKSIKEAEFLYILQMDTKSDEENTALESKLNLAFIDNLSKINEIVNEGKFVLTTRVCRHVLSHGDTKEMETFFKNLPEQVLYDFYSGAVGDGYEFIERYHDNFQVLKKTMFEKNLLDKSSTLYQINL